MAHTVRFGAFTADLTAGELLRDDRKIRLQEKPFQILATLLERPGEVVTRDELRRRLWPADVFVDFDHSLKTAVGKIREALSDSAQRPRFVQTLPHRGYRFVAPVEKPSGNSPERVMLAVLPFKNLSGDREQEHLTDSMTEETTAQLGGLYPQQLGVIARTSAMRFKHANKSIDEIGRELNVDHVVEGSVRRSGKRVRITAQLVQVSDQTHLWAQSYERDLHDILTLQKQVAERIATEIKVKLTALERVLPEPPHRASRDAYEAYLKGRFRLNRRTSEGIRGSIECFKAAIERDPAYAPAYAGLGDAYRISAVFGLGTAAELFPRAEAAAKRALGLEPRLAEAHTSLAGVKLRFDWDWRGSEAGLRRALDLDPQCAEAHRVYALHHQTLGCFDESLRQARLAQESDPLSLLTETAVPWALYFAGRYDEVIRQSEITLAADPNFLPARFNRARALAAKRRFAESLAELEDLVNVSSREPHYLAGLGNAYAWAGRKSKVIAVIRELEERQKRAMVSPYDIAGVYAAWGRKAEAMGWLEKACEERSPRLVLVAVDPVFCGLRADRGFRSILKRVGLPKIDAPGRTKRSA